MANRHTPSNDRPSVRDTTTPGDILAEIDGLSLEKLRLMAGDSVLARCLDRLIHEIDDPNQVVSDFNAAL